MHGHHHEDKALGPKTEPRVQEKDQTTAGRIIYSDDGSGETVAWIRWRGSMPFSHPGKGIESNLGELERTFTAMVGTITVRSEKNSGPAEKKVSVSELNARFTSFLTVWFSRYRGCGRRLRRLWPYKYCGWQNSVAVWPSTWHWGSARIGSTKKIKL